MPNLRPLLPPFLVFSSCSDDADNMNTECNNGTKQATEKCDPGIAAGSGGACPTSCMEDSDGSSLGVSMSAIATPTAGRTTTASMPTMIEPKSALGLRDDTHRAGVGCIHNVRNVAGFPFGVGVSV